CGRPFSCGPAGLAAFRHARNRIASATQGCVNQACLRFGKHFSRFTVALRMRLCLVLLLTAAALLPAPAVLAAEGGDDGLRPGIAPEEGPPLPARRAAAPEADAYAPLGIRAGGFILYPSLTVGAGYTSNAAGVAGAGGSGTGTVAPELLLESDWARHAVTLRLRGVYEKFFDDTVSDNPTATVDATGRLDLADGWAVNLAAGYGFREQALSDPDFPSGADRPPGVHELR